SPQVAAGRELFIANCASCHNKNMQDKLTGPALGGVEERWAAYPRTDLIEFIRNNRKLIKAGHPQAVAVWKEYKPARMNKFSSLTDENVEDLLAYINQVYRSH
ncbi:MAG: cytochrome c, partial [Saprospiraceae bacterium]